MKRFLLLFCAFGFIYSVQAQTLHIVEAGNFFFNPNALTIDVGDTVRWVNLQGTHNVNAATNTVTGVDFDNPESFASAPTNGGELLTRVFTVAGTYQYDCAVGSHAANGMTGTIIVNDNSTSIDEIENKYFNSLNVTYEPNTENIGITFNLKTIPANVFIRISSLTGQLITMKRIETIIGSNEHQLSFESVVSSGIYLVSLQVDGAVETKKVFIR